MLWSRNETPCRPPTHYPHTHPNTHTQLQPQATRSSHLAEFKGLQRPLRSIWTYNRHSTMREKMTFCSKMWFLCACTHVCTCAWLCLCIAACTYVDYPVSSLAHMPSVTQPSHRNPKLGRLVCTHNLCPLCSRSSTWHPLAAGAEGGALAQPLRPDIRSSGGHTQTRC